MDITHFLSSRREEGLLGGDYGIYKKQLGRRLLTLRKKLHFTTPPGKKGSTKKQVKAEGISKNYGFVYLLLLTSERAWAHAMHMKAVHSAETGDQAIGGSAKRHILSRLQKAATNAGRLVTLLQDEQSGSSFDATLHARAYYVSLLGAVAFEKRRWRDCLQHYSEAQLIYSSLSSPQDAKQESVARDLSSSYIEPSLRYAAYQLKVPRSTSIQAIVKDYVPYEESKFVKGILEQHPGVLDEQATGPYKVWKYGSEDIPNTIQWRSRTVRLEDAATAQALAVVASAESVLVTLFESEPGLSPTEKAAAYDDILIASQDAVDATKTAMDELLADGLFQSDPRIQALQITRTAVYYALVGWRSGRNRVLCGEADGAVLAPSQPPPKRKKPPAGTSAGDVGIDVPGQESKSRLLKQFKERVVLYDATLQSLDSVKLLPGAAADSKFVVELQQKRAYFQALRCMAIARSHGLLDSPKNALAILLRAQKISLETKDTGASTTSNSANRPPDLTITKAQINHLQTLLQTLILEYRGLVVLDSFSQDMRSPSKEHTRPLIETLDEYPIYRIDLTKIVSYPPSIAPIPVKPIFLDVAYNYIAYPGPRKRQPQVHTGLNGSVQPDEKKGGKMGWFRFGRQ